MRKTGKRKNKVKKKIYIILFNLFLDNVIREIKWFFGLWLEIKLKNNKN